MTTVNEFFIGLKQNKQSELLKLNIGTPEDAADVCRKCFDSDLMDWKEEMIVIAVNTNNIVLGFYKISSGGISGTVADPRIIFQFALLSSASGIILCHNHPSGNLRPSAADDSITAKISAAGKLLDINLIDHIIITSSGHYSYANSGKL